MCMSMILFFSFIKGMLETRDFSDSVEAWSNLQEEKKKNVMDRKMKIPFQESVNMLTVGCHQGYQPCAWLVRVPPCTCSTRCQRSLHHRRIFFDFGSNKQNKTNNSGPTCDLRELHSGILAPKEVLRIQVVSFFLGLSILLRLGGECSDNFDKTAQLEFSKAHSHRQQLC